MKNLLLILVLLATTSSIKSQEVETSDPKAIQILDDLSNQYKEATAHAIDFSVKIELAERAAEIQKGMLLQSGEKFVLDMDGRSVISDGTTVWMYLAELNEVQINDADFEESEDLLSPTELFNLHRSPNYIFSVSNYMQEMGVDIVQIEGKPVDAYSEYSKMRLTIEQKTLRVVRLKVFGKDGSRYTLRIDNHTKNPKVDEAKFKFDASKYEGVHVEDLRF